MFNIFASMYDLSKSFHLLRSWGPGLGVLHVKVWITYTWKQSVSDGAATIAVKIYTSDGEIEP